MCHLPLNLLAPIVLETASDSRCYLFWVRANYWRGDRSPNKPGNITLRYEEVMYDLTIGCTPLSLGGWRMVANLYALVECLSEADVAALLSL